MRRITLKDLESVIDLLNKATNNPKEPYGHTDAVNGGVRMVKANIGNYHLDGAYGGYKLVQMVSESGGIKDTLRCGFIPKKDLYKLMCAYLEGIELNKD